MRNHFKLGDVVDRAYRSDIVALHPQVPTREVPVLLDVVRPIHGVVPVDVFVPGCPPNADAIWHVLGELLAGRMPDPSAVTRFGM